MGGGVLGRLNAPANVTSEQKGGISGKFQKNFASEQVAPSASRFCNPPWGCRPPKEFFLFPQNVLTAHALAELGLDLVAGQSANGQSQNGVRLIAI